MYWKLINHKKLAHGLRPILDEFLCPTQRQTVLGWQGKLTHDRES